MKLIKKVIEKDGSVSITRCGPGQARWRLIITYAFPKPQGYVKLRPEDDEDMWHIYNLISVVRNCCACGCFELA